MRILTVCADLNRGGTQRVAQNFAIEYLRQGHASAVLAYKNGGLRQAYLEGAGVEVFIGGDQLRKALDAAKEFNPDVIHIHRIGLPDAEQTKLLSILQTDDRRIIETNVFSRADLSEADRLIDVHLQLSEWCMWRWRKRLGDASERCAGIVVPNAVDCDSFKPGDPQDVLLYRQKALNLPGDAFVCSRVSQPFAVKWHHKTFDAFQLLAERNPKAYLVLVGFPKTCNQYLTRLSAEVRSRIRILDLIDDDYELSLLYSTSDCFLHAAHIGESFGLVFCESMLCETPVVTASRPYKDNSQIEVVGHMEGGIVAGTIARLPDALLKIHEDHNLRYCLGTKARRRIIDRYDVKHVAAIVIRIAEISLNHYERRALMQTLGETGGFITHVSDQRIIELLENTLGGPTINEIFKMRIKHIPFINRALEKLLRIRDQSSFKRFLPLHRIG